jgi:hypothetical protein
LLPIASGALAADGTKKLADLGQGWPTHWDIVDEIFAGDHFASRGVNQVASSKLHLVSHLRPRFLAVYLPSADPLTAKPEKPVRSLGLSPDFRSADELDHCQSLVPRGPVCDLAAVPKVPQSDLHRR